MAPMCKLNMQKFQGKVNYLRRFISNLVGKVDPFTHILRFKSDDGFTWEQNINGLLSCSAPKINHKNVSLNLPLIQN